MAQGRVPVKRQGRKWRVSWDSASGKRCDISDAGDFDELVLDDWLHIERMDDRAWWMQIGDAYVSVVIDRHGRAHVGIRRGEYGDTYGWTEGQLETPEKKRWHK